VSSFAELCVASNFSFLRGGSHPEELARQANYISLSAISICDRNTLAGVVRGHIATNQAGLRYVVGCRLAFIDGTPDILAWPTNRDAYGRLCRLLTEGNRRAPKGECYLTRTDLLTWGAGIMLGVMPRARIDAVLKDTLVELDAAFPDSVRLLAAVTYGPHDRRRLARLMELSRRSGVKLMATNDVLYHNADRRMLQDIVTCIREHVTLAAAGKRLAANAERHLKPAAEMMRLFRDCPEAVAESMNVLERIDFSLDELQYQYPDEPTGDAASPQEALEKLTKAGAHRRYPDGVPEKVRKALVHELELIARLKYAPYFLTVHDIIRYATEKGILCQGRGSAANSVVCYCLGITEVEPGIIDPLFERFISEERGEPPDIDVDFEHERREEVMQYVYDKYGRHRAGIAATVITYRTRSAVREVGKVFGLSEDVIGALAGSIWGWSNEGVANADARRLGLDPEERTMRMVLGYARELIGFPRHLSQHVGGFVITRDRLDDLVPVMNAAMEDRTHVEWDKDDLDQMKMLKVDVLALGMLSAIRKSFEFIARSYGKHYSLATIPKEEEAVYDMICRADTLGVFQVESRAQMSMLPRLRPRKFYDLVIEVAIVRPGPIQGNMVHPYLKRRDGKEEPHYPSPSPPHPQDELKQVLVRTLGVPLFQEQAMKIAIVAAGFDPGEADNLRRAMATFRRSGTIQFFRDKFIRGMTSRGYEQDFAERCFRQIEGFADYGFPESHAASFALLVYASAWIKCHYPDVFCAALLNSQPMGFYAPAQIVRDAREHGVTVLPPDVNLSDWDTVLEEMPEEGGGAVEAIRLSLSLPRKGEGAASQLPPMARLHPAHESMRDQIHTTHAVRLGFRQISGFSQDDALKLMVARRRGYDSVRDLWLRSGLTRSAIERLSEADAFRSLGLDRRAALWAAQGLGGGGHKDRLPLFDKAALGDIRREPDVDLPPMPLGEHVVNDYRYLSLSLKAHPVGFLRTRLAAERVVENRLLSELPDGKYVTVSGLVLVRQRPGTASGVIFMTIEDETGIANVIVWPRTFERFRPVVLGARLITVTGKMQSEKGVIHVIADRITDRTPLLAVLSADNAAVEPLSRADEVKHPPIEISKKTIRRALLEGTSPALIVEAENHARVMPKGRNFH
jgi:error-prone DNA polymerase